MMAWQWHQLDNMQIICTSLQTDNHAHTSPLMKKMDGKPANFCVLLYYLNFVFYCTHVRMSYVLNSYLLTYLIQFHLKNGHLK